MVGIAVVLYIGAYSKSKCFGVMSENVTGNLRIKLYDAILEKHMGWFDDREHATSVLTTAMSEDTNKINEVGSSTLGALTGAAGSLVVGICIGLFFNW